MKEERIKQVIGAFSAASFLNDLGSDMIFPIWPLFVTALPGANMAVLGLIDGLGDAFASLSQAGSGYLSACVHGCTSLSSVCVRCQLR